MFAEDMVYNRNEKGNTSCIVRMQIRKIDSGGYAPTARSFAFEVSIKYGHRRETKSLDNFEPFCRKFKVISVITDEDTTASNAPVTVASFTEKFYGIVERG